MTGHPHTLAEWAAVLDLGASVYASFSVFWFLFVDSHRSDFDPRPAARQIHQGAVHAGHDVNRALATGQRVARASLRDAALSVAALLMLLTATPGDAR